MSFIEIIHFIPKRRVFKGKLGDLIPIKRTVKNFGKFIRSSNPNLYPPPIRLINEHRVIQELISNIRNSFARCKYFE